MVSSAPKIIDRKTGQKIDEQVYGKVFIDLFYGPSWISHIFFVCVLPLIVRVSFFSHFYGWLQRSCWSRRKVLPFIRTFRVDEREFAQPATTFSSFNDFFIRKLKKGCRPLAKGEEIAVLPADGRYLVVPDLSQTQGLWIKGQQLGLPELLQDSLLARTYEKGSMAIARLCPTDYHRFHFPCSGTPGKSRLINGPLYSVNPLALKKMIRILTENKRVITLVPTRHFGQIAYIEVGATHVGSVHQTFEPGNHYAKGDEKGYFSFGGSCLLLLFEPGRILFDADLLRASAEHTEMLGLVGESMGKALQIGHSATL